MEAYVKKLHLLQRPELFPGRLLPLHGTEDAIFNLYFQSLVLETNVYNEKSSLEFSMKIINNGPEETYFQLYRTVEYSKFN